MREMAKKRKEQDGVPVCVPHKGLEKGFNLLRLDLHRSPLANRVDSGAFVALGRPLGSTVDFSVLAVKSGIRVEFW